MLDHIQIIHYLEGKTGNKDDKWISTGVEPVIKTNSNVSLKPDIVVGSTLKSEAPTVVASNHMEQPVPVIHATSPITASTPPISQSHSPIKDSTPPIILVEDPTDNETPYPLSLIRLGRDPCRVNCPSCQSDVFTHVRSHADAVTWIAFVLLLICFWPLCWLPFVVPSCQSVDHVCPSCRRIISTTRACE